MKTYPECLRSTFIDPGANAQTPTLQLARMQAQTAEITKTKKTAKGHKEAIVTTSNTTGLFQGAFRQGICLRIQSSPHTPWPTR
jgi:hypothetical protein